ncbi:hypothetical protein [Nocardia sp. NPDC004722]
MVFADHADAGAQRLLPARSTRPLFQVGLGGGDGPDRFDRHHPRPVRFGAPGQVSQLLRDSAFHEITSTVE